MIQLTRLNGVKFILNCDLIKIIETTPDTVIALTQGDRIMVKESVEKVLELTMNYRKQLYQEPPTQMRMN